MKMYSLQFVTLENLTEKTETVQDYIFITPIYKMCWQWEFLLACNSRKFSKSDPQKINALMPLYILVATSVCSALYAGKLCFSECDSTGETSSF